MKKILLVLMVLVMGLSVSACKKNKNKEDDSTKKTVIKYCAWNFGTSEENNLTRRLIEKYNKDSKTVKVEMTVPEGDYDTFLSTLAAANNLPDVFMVNNVPTAIINKLALDLTDIVKNDSEWASVQQSLKDSITYNEHTYAIPNGQFYLGYAVNYDLVNDFIQGDKTAQEIFTPGKFSYEDLFNTVKQMRVLDKTDGTGVIGIEGVGDMVNWLPSILDKSGKTGHFVWNGYYFDYSSDFLIDAMTQMNSLAGQGTEDGFTLQSLNTTEDPERLNNLFNASGQDDVFKLGRMGFLQVGTYSVFDYDFNYKFIGLPNSRVISVTDYLCLSKALESNDLKKQAAYDFAKYLSFGIDGYNDKFEIIDNNLDATNLTLAGTPLIDNEEIKNKWFDYVTLPGAEEIFDKVMSGELISLVEGLKSTPGFQVARFYYNTGISIPEVREGNELTIGDLIWDTCGGDISINQYRANMTEELQSRMNALIDEAYEDMGITREIPE